MKKIISLSLCYLMLIYTTGCGYLIYPERQFQRRHGKIDTNILILDSLALFFFIIPGVVSLTVDFSTNSIYLPAGHHANGQGKTIYMSEDMSNEAIEKAVYKETKLAINLDNAVVSKL